MVGAPLAVARDPEVAVGAARFGLRVFSPSSRGGCLLTCLILAIFEVLLCRRNCGLRFGV